MKNTRSYKTFIKAAAVWLLFVAVVFVILYFRYIVYPRDKEGMESRYHVEVDDSLFQMERADHMYMAGDEVPLVFPKDRDDPAYTFQLDGVDEFTAGYYPGTGYLIVFVMPANDVHVSYELQDITDSASDSVQEINIALSENPTTGFIWEYEFSQDGIVELADERYVSDMNESDEPISGLGGTQFWIFRVVGSGTVDIRFTERRGEEQLYPEMIYRYVCDETGASFVEQYQVDREE